MFNRFAAISTIAVVAAVLAGVALAAGGPGGDMSQAQAAGWDCNPQVLIIG